MGRRGVCICISRPLGPPIGAAYPTPRETAIADITTTSADIYASGRPTSPPSRLQRISGNWHRSHRQPKFRIATLSFFRPVLHIWRKTPLMRSAPVGMRRPLMLSVMIVFPPRALSRVGIFYSCSYIRLLLYTYCSRTNRRWAEYLQFYTWLLTWCVTRPT